MAVTNNMIMPSPANHKITSRQGSSSTITSSPDDYGECDVSLQSYNRSLTDKAQFHRLSESSKSRADATDALSRRLRSFGPSSGDKLKVSKSGKCSFNTVGGNTVDLSIRDDCKAIIISSVVHKVKHGDILRQNSSRQSTRGTYSLMTKMMKYNALLSRQHSRDGETRGSICAHDGTFLFHVSLSISALTQPRKLEESLRNAILQTMEISKEFSMMRVENRDQAAHRRKLFILGAYSRNTNY